MKVMFSCNVSKSGGAGHLIRSISLAEQARFRGFESIFFGRFDTPFARTVLSDSGFTSRAFAGDSAELANLAAELEVNVVHCDDYESRQELHDALSPQGILFSSIEDGEFGRRSADIVIDPSPSAEFVYRQGGSSAIHLRGLSYIPLRQAISAAARNRQASPLGTEDSEGGRYSVLIVLGGTDAASATTRVVDTWTEAVPGTTCFAVLPGQRLPVLETKGSSEIHWLPPTPDMATLLSKVDAVITAAGTTVWEVAAIGIPAAVIQQAENQSSNYHYVVGRGAMVGLGTVEGMFENQSRLRAAMRQIPRLTAAPTSTIDALGADRIVSEWIDVLAEPRNLRIREARLSDASNLFDWRNDSVVRSVSRDTNPLRWEDHLRWLELVLSASDRKLLVAAQGQSLAGTARFDQLDETAEKWEISLSLSPASRGKGLGNELLNGAEAWLRLHSEGDLQVVANVKHDNKASRLLFANNGYHENDSASASEFVEWNKRLKQFV